MDSTRLVAVGSSILLFIFVLELVRRRKLREEYSWLWLAMSTGYFVLAAYPPFPRWLAHLIGAEKVTSAFNFLGILFLVFICIQFSVRLSRLTNRNKHLAQQLAVLDGELQALRQQVHQAGAPLAGEGWRGAAVAELTRETEEEPMPALAGDSTP